MEPIEILFADKSVSFETFMQNLSARIVTYLKEDQNDPEYVSQREAFRRFGEQNVRRWLVNGKIEPCKRPGKIEYPMKRLRELSRVVQDYL